MALWYFSRSVCCPLFQQILATPLLLQQNICFSSFEFLVSFFWHSLTFCWGWCFQVEVILMKLIILKEHHAHYVMGGDDHASPYESTSKFCHLWILTTTKSPTLKLQEILRSIQIFHLACYIPYAKLWIWYQHHFTKFFKNIISFIC